MAFPGTGAFTGSTSEHCLREGKKKEITVQEGTERAGNLVREYIECSGRMRSIENCSNRRGERRGSAETACSDEGGCPSLLLNRVRREKSVAPAVNKSRCIVGT